MGGGDLLGNIKFVRIVSVHELPYAEALQHLLRRSGVAAVIINDERVQGRAPSERADAEAPGEGFRLEVPESMASKAHEILSSVRRAEDSA
jgi:hypothetical protein